MTSQQLYDDALKFLNGTGGYPKNLKKGEKLMLQASNAGSRQAAGYYATHFAKNDGEMLMHLQKSGAYEDHPNEYVRCLYTTAKKAMKKDPAIAKNNYDAANRVQAQYHDDGYYYKAELAKLAGDPDEKYRSYLYLAALGMSKAMPDEAYALIGRDRGVIYNKDELDAYVKANEIKLGGFAEVTKTEEEAWRIVEANLSTKEGKAKLPAGAAGAMLKKRPTGTLEYQRVLRACYRTSRMSVGFEYNNPSYSTVTRGTVSDWDVPEDKQYTAFWYTDFRYFAKQSVAWESLKQLKYSNTYPTNLIFQKARFRVDTPYYYSLMSKCMDAAKASSRSNSIRHFKEALGTQKNWSTGHITANIQTANTGLDSFKIYFVPFYYFTVELAFGKTATVRVNAQTGDTEYYENCPFGQFTEYDDYETGGNVKLDKEKVDAVKKAASRKSAKKDRTIGKGCFIAAVALIILTIIIGSGELAALTFVGAIGSAIAGVFFFFKSFFTSLISKFKK